jgi:hypothetical protein
MSAGFVLKQTKGFLDVSSKLDLVPLAPGDEPFLQLHVFSTACVKQAIKWHHDII